MTPHASHTLPGPLVHPPVGSASAVGRACSCACCAVTPSRPIAIPLVRAVRCVPLSPRVGVLPRAPLQPRVCLRVPFPWQAKWNAMQDNKTELAMKASYKSMANLKASIDQAQVRAVPSMDTEGGFTCGPRLSVY